MVRFRLVSVATGGDDWAAVDGEGDAGARRPTHRPVGGCGQSSSKPV